MKRPTFALLSLLALLALGLVAAGPKRSEAGSLGELAFAMQVEETCAGDPIVCPLVCCPLAEEFERCEAALNADATMELNAAETTDVADAATNEGRSEAVYDDYAAPYADAVEATSETPEVDEDIELNAADAEATAGREGNCFEDYYGDYIYDATEYSDDYFVEVDGEESCNDVVHDPVWLPRKDDAGSQISEADLEVQNVASDEAASAWCRGNHCTADSCPIAEPSAANPFNEYGRQVGDSYAAEAYEEDYYGYYNDEYYDDEYYYEYGYDEDVPEAQVEDVEAEVSADATVAAADETSELEDAYYEDYFYEDYYSEDFDSAEYGEDDYERYYSEEYYEQLDEAEEKAASADVNEEVAADADIADAYASEYDAMYDEVVYGDNVDAPTLEEAESIRDDLPCPPVVTADMLPTKANVAPAPAIVVADPATRAYLAGRCIDEANAELIDDLPWADEVEVAAESHANVAEIDVPACEASEYGSDYADDFYRTLEEELLPLDEQAAAAAPAAMHAENLPIAAAKTVHSKFDIRRLATFCGGKFAAWTESMTEFGNAIRTACGDVDLDTQTR